MQNKKYNTLFLCTGNSARSILAEAILTRVGSKQFSAYSAGSDPADMVNPFAITLLKTKDYPTGNLRSKSWDEFSMPNELKLDLVITVCDNAAGEICPVWYGEPTRVHWSIPDPATVLGNDDKKMATFEKVFDLLQTRISALVNLPILEISHSELTDALNKLT
ncbi:MAG: protein-tyrosine-phosphatase [Acidiferrobacteraceae bacterium]|nr:protein-tyrosine-phosphatase [Acidiferrobacteraceae bacterium]|tara:strand:- start:430 stop:918 length:489 start_codon:yes stop_codon:yes gene_type:complete